MSKILFEALIMGIAALLGAVIYFMMFDDFMRFDADRGEHIARSGEATTVDREHLLSHDGRRRRYLVHVPLGYDGSRPLPVVLGLHGGGGRAEAQRKQSRMNDVADRHGFLAVYPDGTGFGPLTWNAGTCCGYAVQKRVDDVGFVRALLDELPRRYAVDTRRVYATGMSNGAMLCYRLACELSDRIAAIAPVSGDMGVDGPRPSRPVPVLHFHGLKDPNVLFLGGVGPNQWQRTPHRAIPETVAWWVKANHCRPEPTITRGEDFIRESYAPAAGQAGAPVVLYELPEGGHAWPGGVDVTAHLGTGRLIASVDAGAIMWEFFRQFALDGPAAVETP